MIIGIVCYNIAGMGALCCIYTLMRAGIWGSTS